MPLFMLFKFTPVLAIHYFEINLQLLAQPLTRITLAFDLNHSSSPIRPPLDQGIRRAEYNSETATACDRGSRVTLVLLDRNLHISYKQCTSY